MIRITGIGIRNRRAKGKNLKPIVFLILELLLLVLLVFVISYFEITFLTIVSALAAFYFFIMSSFARFRKIRFRQVHHHVHNNIDKIK